MSPSPLARKIPLVSTSLPLLAELVLNLILTVAGRPEIIFCRFNSVDSPKFRTTIKILSMPSSSLVYTT
uniref:Uncharacterized protein n=1 Tax=Theropithecus gelada TaxID=9565 RepID=A0A8D2E6F7_THEGE